MFIVADSTHDPLSSPRIIAADRLNDGIVIEFDNGRRAFYPEAFLYSKINECRQLNEDDEEW